MAIFDVGDVEHPKELHKELIGDRGTDSPVLSDHRAFLFDREKLPSNRYVLKLDQGEARAGDEMEQATIDHGAQDFTNFGAADSIQRLSRVIIQCSAIAHMA